ncbi:hypothetical protein LEP1GSC125_1004 [Leptospira mayottensis 200901122]|uniref:Uncharacterized protein n=1 Tax=Leptospira mayottensis 200901122 TaxID=1193010 RepID=A0AA87MJW6_9LEPT|nr:hypothetical protein LEP1GSC125_1004 [Leptospira mayottensis 200901122]
MAVFLRYIPFYRKSCNRNRFKIWQNGVLHITRKKILCMHFDEILKVMEK